MGTNEYYLLNGKRSSKDQLRIYGHIQRMKEEKLPFKYVAVVSNKKRKRTEFCNYTPVDNMY
jgi:hypothetical protein